MKHSNLQYGIVWYNNPRIAQRPASLAEAIVVAISATGSALIEHLRLDREELSLYVFVTFDGYLRASLISATDEETARQIAETGSESDWQLVYQYPEPA